jgi:hypothetical protein
MAHREYLIHYPNGFKQHVSRAELAAMNSLEQIGNKAYRAPAASIEQANGPHYLSGSWIFELKGKRYKDLPETPRGMVERLGKAGAFA